MNQHFFFCQIETSQVSDSSQCCGWKKYDSFNSKDVVNFHLLQKKYDSFNSKEVGNFHFPVKKKLQVIAPVFCLDFLTKVDGGLPSDSGAQVHLLNGGGISTQLPHDLIAQQ